jgi:hypothetical protein
MDEIKIKDITNDRKLFLSFFGLSVCDYWVFDGEWVNQGEIICEVQFQSDYTRIKIVANKSGIVQYNDELYSEKLRFLDRSLVSEFTIIFLHEIGQYPNENHKELQNYSLKISANKFKNQDKLEHTQFCDFDDLNSLDGKYINTNEPVFTFSYRDHKWTYYSEKSGYIDVNYHTIISKGVVCHLEQFKSNRFDNPVLIIREDDKERIIRKFYNKPILLYDKIEKTSNIKWEAVGGFNLNCIITYSTDDSFELFFSINLIQNIPYLVINYNLQKLKLKNGDVVYFCFENSIVLEYYIKDKPYQIVCENGLKYSEVKFKLDKNDFNSFRDLTFEGWKIKQTQEQIIHFSNHINTAYLNSTNLQIVINNLFKDFLEFGNKNIQNFESLFNCNNQIEELKKTNSNQNEECYVYLMIDKINKYHKIGLSNSPKFREKTLQSEKPTIEIVLSKKYTNRRIASMIEKSFHQLYSNKRIRGEWFKLDEEELNEIIHTLSN